MDASTEPDVSSWDNEPKDTPTPKTTRFYACVRCGHEVAEGGGEASRLNQTVSPNVLFGKCQNCIILKREAQRQKVRQGPLPKDTPVAFRRV